MKVTSENNTQLNGATTIDKDSSRSDPDSLAGDDLELNVLSDKTSFATVLDRVTQSRKESHTDHTDRGSSAQAASHENKAKPKSDTEDTVPVAIADRSLIREPFANAETNTDIRAVLHTVDVEKIVAACRVQVTAGGQHEVTIDLSHSVLAGLRVKVSADSAGRVATEFLAANEGVKSLLDARSSDLIALLRSRGINLMSFKSSLAADANDGGGSRQSREDDKSNVEAVGQNRSTSLSNESEYESAAVEEIATGATYRG